MKELIKQLYKYLYNEELVKIECPVPVVPPKTNREKLFDTAVSFLGKDASPRDYADDEYGCMESVDEVHHACFGSYIDPLASIPSTKTYYTYNYLLTAKDFIMPAEPLFGDIIISPTGYGNGKIASGHVGILGKSNIIMSNNSANGKWEENYTTTTWQARFKDIGGFPMKFFRKV